MHTLARKEDPSPALVAPHPAAPSLAVALESGIWPGLVLTAIVAAAAYAVRQLPGGTIFSPMILAIVIGIAFQNIVGTPHKARAGVTFALRRLLRLAIVLLGLQLTTAQVAGVGGTGVAVIALSLVATFLFTTWLGRLLGVDRKLTELIAAGTSICGASAVIAANTVTEAHDEDVAYAVACVTVFGSIAMFVYPLLPGLLALSPHGYGLWAGASIHEIAQVVAAGFQDGRDAGEFATIAKLSRVMLLAPVVITLGLLAARRLRRHGHATRAAKPPMPWFVLGFVAMVGLNSLVSIPQEIKTGIATATTLLLAMALAAMGLETKIDKLRAKGLRPLLLGLAASLFIAGFSLMLVKITT
ncbi:MAG: YeiH family putative sulfate export transporter [Rhodopseudomonas sp.]|uniref:YeiH family protein n=1 Tax=Rhodopseudomonas sp. TaxID=1078 RepID=UPI00182B9685|nr:YeiH family protein [Rhodopseudomonas sp.]NVN84926.1 YeiH family putative sulfate export transporter [Rhodopseudomonas sp.]